MIYKHRSWVASDSAEWVLVATETDALGNVGVNYFINIFLTMVYITNFVIVQPCFDVEKIKLKMRKSACLLVAGVAQRKQRARGHENDVPSTRSTLYSCTFLWSRTKYVLRLEGRNLFVDSTSRCYKFYLHSRIP